MTVVSNLDRPSRPSEIRCLTGLRGVAATMVMLYHLTLSIPPGGVPLQSWFHKGYLFVDLFFILSGFVMGYSQAGLFAGGYDVRSHLKYLLARIARIYPLYAVISLESACSIAYRTPDLVSHGLPWTLFLNLTLVQAWGLAPSLEGAAWSISTEWGAYLLFPLLLTLALSRSTRIVLAVAITAMVLIVSLAMTTGGVTFPGQSRVGPLDIYSSATALPLVRCLAEFSLGLVAYRVARDLGFGSKAWTRPLSVGTVLLLATGLSPWGSDVLVVATFAVLLVALAPQTGIVAQCLGGSVLYRLGQWSYSIYLIHDKFSHPARELQRWFAERVPMASEITLLLMTGIIITCGSVTYFVVELPLRKLILKRLRRPLLRNDEPATVLQSELRDGGANAVI